MTSSPPTQPKIGYRSAMDDMTDFLLSGSKMAAYRMDRKTAPGWYEALEELSKKAGVTPPALYRVPTYRINGGMAFDALVLTDGLIVAAGSHPNDLRPSADVIRMMAHEIGHHKQSILPRIGARLLPWAMPLASMAALYIYDQAVKEKQNQPLLDMNAALDKATDHAVTQIDKTHDLSAFEDKHSRDVTVAWKQSVLHNGRYLLAAALGLTGGLLSVRAIARHLEFDADRAAVMLTGDKEGYIRFLEKGQAAANRQFSKELIHKPSPKNTIEKLQDYIAGEWKDLMSRTLHAHPSTSERAIALGVKPKADFRTRVTHSAAEGIAKS